MNGDKLVLITGGARRVGRSLALAVAHAGSDVVVHYGQSQEEAESVRETGSMTRTTVWRGNYANDASLRSEFFTACGLQRSER